MVTFFQNRKFENQINEPDKTVKTECPVLFSRFNLIINFSVLENQNFIFDVVESMAIKSQWASVQGKSHIDIPTLGAWRPHAIWKMLGLWYGRIFRVQTLCDKETANVPIICAPIKAKYLVISCGDRLIRIIV